MRTPEKVYEDLVTAGEAWAAAHADARRLDLHAKTVYAEARREARRNGVKTAAEADDVAATDDDYIAFRRKAIVADEQEMVAKVRFQAEQVKADFERTNAVYERTLLTGR